MRTKFAALALLVLPHCRLLGQSGQSIILGEHIFDVSQARNNPPAANAQFDLPFRFRENAPYSWKGRTFASNPLAPSPQDLLGALYYSESGAFNPRFSTPFDAGSAGLATSGTRLILRFSGVPSGVRILAPTQLIASRIPSGPGAVAAIRINAGSNGQGPYSPVTPTVTAGNVSFAPAPADSNGNAWAVWEFVTPGDPGNIREIVSGVLFSYAAGAATGSIWMTGSYAPLADSDASPSSAPSFSAAFVSRVRVAHFRSGPAFVDRLPLRSGRLGIAYGAAIPGTLGPPGPYFGTPLFEVSSGQLPPGITMTETGVLQGTPSAAGTFDFRVRIRGSIAGGLTVESPVLTLAVLPALRINSLPDATEDLAYSQSFTATGGRPPYRFDFHGVIGPAPAVVPAMATARPNDAPAVRGFASPAGSFVFDMTVTDADGYSLRSPVSLRILPATGRPTFREPAPDQQVGVPGATITWNPVPGTLSHDVEVVEPTTAFDDFYGFQSVGRHPADRTMFAMNVPAAGGNSVFVNLPIPRPWQTFSTNKYEARVRGCFDAGRANCTPWSFRRFQIAPSTPAGVPSLLSPASSPALTSTTVDFRWQPVQGATRYEVEVGNVPDTIYKISVTGTSTIATIPEGRWRWSVRACSTFCDPVSASGFFDVAPGSALLGPPSGIDARVAGPGALTVSWQAVAGADSYEVAVVQPGSGPGGGALTVAAARTSQATVTFPCPAGAAGVIVRACATNCSGWSGAINVNVPGPSPAAPVIASPLPAARVSGPVTFFSWSRIPGDNGTNTTYRLYVQDMFRQAPGLDVRTRENYFAAAFAAEGTRYDAVVVANPDSASPLPSAPVGFMVDGSSAQAPTIVSPAHQSSVRQGVIPIAWSPTLYSTTYEFYMAPASGEVIRGVATGALTYVPLTAPGGRATRYNVIMRSCLSRTCVPGVDEHWGPWSDAAGSGVLSFDLLP